MKKSALLILAFLILATPTFAESTVDVRVKNNVNPSSNSTVNSNTDITVETNGKVTNYSSNKPVDVEIKSVNGQTEIKENGVVISKSPKAQASTTPTLTPQPKDEDENGKDQKNIFDIFKDLFKTIFSLLA